MSSRNNLTVDFFYRKVEFCSGFVKYFPSDNVDCLMGFGDVKFFENFRKKKFENFDFFLFIVYGFGKDFWIFGFWSGEAGEEEEVRKKARF